MLHTVFVIIFVQYKLYQQSRCKSLKWPPVSGGRRPFRPILKFMKIIKFGYQLVDDWMFEPRPKWPMAIWGGPK